MYQVHTIKRLPGNSLNIARKWTGYFLTQKIHYSPKDNQRNTMIALHGLDSSMVYPEYSTIEKHLQWPPEQLWHSQHPLWVKNPVRPSNTEEEEKKREDAKSARLKPYPQTPLVAKARHVTTSRNEPRVGLEMVHK